MVMGGDGDVDVAAEVLVLLRLTCGHTCHE
jgi:hypothetical protein